MSVPQPPSYFPAPRRAHFCSQCGSPVARRVPDGDNRERDLCDHCGAIHYQNPRMVVGTVPTWQGRILLCRRAIEPRYDTWTLPAGFMELGESTAQGAERETLEESGARIALGQLYTVIDVPQVEQVHFFYLAEALGPELDPGPESLEARYFDESEIPWDDLSFRTVATTLQRYLEDRKRGAFATHHYVLDSRR
ncbi:NUDIX hydrolase [Bordetella genomosp. 13]|uniref:NUDIX hydrolase n=1 Tax=Bordetella genomosp. 13 TaxID=463040 RepID=UPI0011A47280|nr:NUDIX hydrolase [Bordetella genomosp. 13]